MNPLMHSPVDLAAHHFATKSTAVVARPRGMGARTPPLWMPWVARYRAQRVGSSQSAIGGRRGKSSVAVDDEPLICAECINLHCSGLIGYRIAVNEFRSLSVTLPHCYVL